MSNETTKKGRFNAIDALIILLTLTCIFGVVCRYVMIDSRDDGLLEYTVSFRIDDVSSSALDHISVGDAFRIKTSGVELGCIESVASNGPAIGAYDDNGEPIYYPTSSGEAERISITGTLTVQGRMTESGLLVGSYMYLSPNSTLQTVSERIDVAIRIMNIIEK